VFLRQRSKGKKKPDAPPRHRNNTLHQRNMFICFILFVAAAAAISVLFVRVFAQPR